MTDWSFLTNHAHALLAVAVDPEIRLRDLAVSVGVTERAAHKLVSDLVDGGYLTKERVGRRNCYEIHPDLPLRRESYRDHTIGEILEVLAKARPAVPPPAAAAGVKAASSRPAKAKAKAKAKKVTKKALTASGSAAPAGASRKRLSTRP